MGHLEGPVSQARWAPEIMAQSLELLIVHLDPASEGIIALGPVHAPSLQVGWSPGVPADEVLRPLFGRYGLVARVLHSTSWRHAVDHVVLTYLAVVDAPDAPSEHLVSAQVGRTELARGDATSAPTAIAIEQVLEHALRHLAWLRADDPAVAAALPDWSDPLANYVPEPFRGL